MQQLDRHLVTPWLRRLSILVFWRHDHKLFHLADSASQHLRVPLSLWLSHTGEHQFFADYGQWQSLWPRGRVFVNGSSISAADERREHEVAGFNSDLHGALRYG